MGAQVSCRTVTFTVPGKALGYVARTTFNKNRNPRALRYHAYKKRVETFARLAGVPMPPPSTFERPCRVDIAVYRQNRTGCDIENVQKGIRDALFYGGDDRYCYGGHAPWRIDTLNPRVDVTVTWWEEEEDGA